jgi:2-oxoglutarate ferredoxin oxidoreductase subunit alpha
MMLQVEIMTKSTSTATSPSTESKSAAGGESGTKPLRDISLLVGGQGGDGTLTVADLLARYFNSQGLYIYGTRRILSRIRGGLAAGATRASVDPVWAQKGTHDVLVAFYQEAVTFGQKDLSPGGFILLDEKVATAEGERVYSLPLSLTAASSVGNGLYKNTLSYGALSVMLGMDRTAARGVVEKRFGKMSAERLTKNLTAFDLGVEMASKQFGEKPLIRMEKGAASGLHMFNGNRAAALGFIVGGARFFSGYPITPATPLLETMQEYLPQFGGVVRQVEDELSAINMALGAAYAGVRAMTATSGPGFALMSEALGHAGMAEIPVVIVDCQRVGPSTGQPTRHEQSDVLTAVFMSHGESPRVVIAPGFTEDAFNMAPVALNLAERWQMPVIMLMDQALCENTVSSPDFDLASVRVDRGKLLTEAELQKMDVYKRYQFTDDGVSPRVVPGMKGGQYQATGNEHDEWGHVTINLQNRNQMMAKRMGHVEHAKADLPPPLIWGEEKSAKVGFIGFGSTYGPIREAQTILDKEGVTTRFYQARTIWPVPVDTLQPFLDSVDVAYVVEHNYMGQFAMLIKEFIKDPKIKNILKYDGESFRAHEIVNAVQGGQ